MMVVLADPLKKHLHDYSVRVQDNAAAVVALENESQEMEERSKRPRAQQPDKESCKSSRMDDEGNGGQEKNLFKNLNGVLCFCADKRNGRKMVRDNSGLYRLWSKKDIEEFLVDGEFDATQVLDIKREDNILQEEEFLKGGGGSDNMGINFDHLCHMAIVKDPKKFERYMRHQLTLHDRSQVCLDDFTRDGSLLPLLSDVSSDYREKLGKALKGLALFEQFYRSPRVAQVLAAFAAKVELDSQSPFKYVGCEILTTAFEFEWIKWQREVYNSPSQEWFTEEGCANKLEERLVDLVEVFRTGIHEGARYSERAFYGEGGMWHQLKGRKTGQDKARVVTPKPSSKGLEASQPSTGTSNSTPCVFYAASILGLKDENGKEIECDRRSCRQPHPTSLDKVAATRTLYSSNLNTSLTAAVNAWTNKQ